MIDNESDMTEVTEVTSENDDNLVEKTSPIASEDLEIKVGRPATVSDEDFMKVHRNSANIDDVIRAFPSLQSMEPKKARLYVSMRSATLRKKHGQSALKTFPRGRKGSPKPSGSNTPPVME